MASSACHVRKIVGRIFGRRPDCTGYPLGLIGHVEMDQGRLHRLAVWFQGVLQPAPMGGRFCQSEAALTPEDASHLLDQMLLGWSLRNMLGDKRCD